jgi:hypothetical protein
MAVEVQHDGPARFALAGLDLNAPVDLVPPTKYSRANNVVSKIEGQMQTRDGTTRLAQVAAGTPIHTIFRLAQSAAGILSERLVGAGTQLYTAALPPGNSFAALAGGPTFDGGPISIIQFRFASDPVGVWAIIANSAGMMKRRAGYYQLLGVAPPTVQSAATAGGVGLLNSSTGTPYDWRYTYLNEVTLSESNGSPIMLTGAGMTVTRPSAFTNPSSGAAGDPYVNPSNAFDNNLATFAQGQENVADNSGGGASGEASCQWQGVPAYTGPTASTLTLTVVSSASIVLSLHNGGVGGGNLILQYSTDAGTTWTNIYDLLTGSANQRTDNVAIPPTTYLPNLIVRGITTANVVGPGPLLSRVIATQQVFEIYVTVTSAAGNVLTLALTNQSANVCVTPPVDPQETAIRLYRRGGTLPNNWFQVGQFKVLTLSQGSCSTGTLLINDNVPDSTAQLGAILPQDNFQPISSVQAVNFSLPIVFGPYNGQVLACGDPARPESVYFSQNGNADIWPAENWVVVGNPGEPMMNGIVYGLRCFVFSRERMFIMLPNIIAGVTFTPAETSCRRGLKGRWALCGGKQGIYFGAKDGIYRTAGGPEQDVTGDIRPLFPTREAPTGFSVHGYDAIDMSQENALRLTFHNNEIWFFYQGLNTGLPQLLIFDEDRSRWRAGVYPDGQVMAYSEPNTSSSLLMGAKDGDVYQVSGGVDGENNVPIPVNFRTGAYDQGRPLNLKEYLTVNIDIDPGGATVGSPVTITPLINGETVTEAALQVSGSGRQRVTLPLNQVGTEIYGYNIEFDFVWNGTGIIQPVAYQYEILYRHEPAEVTHWELPSTSFGVEGWLHLRDVYITLRSTAPVTLKVTPDGAAAQSFTLPSTAGAKKKLYVQLAFNKAKLYSFTLDSAATFRVYADESEVRIKPWLTKLGYKNVPILVREQVGKPFGLSNV